MAAAGSAHAAESSVLGSNFAPYITNTLTAPANITAGEYVVAAGVMYRATVNIASGSTLTPNGNVFAVTVGEELTKVIASDARKADADGTSPNLTAGNALQLVSTVGVEDQVPYNFRASGGGADIGDRETDMIVGGTVAWNQWFDDNTPNVSSGATITGSDGVYTFTAGAQNDQVYMQQRSSLVVANHVYLCSVTFSTSDPANVKARMFSQDIESDDTTGWQTKVKFRKSASTSSFTVGVRDTRASGWDGVAVKWFMLFDLTQMFGTTIADYVYSLEQANAGDGVAWFKKLFPNDYYAYDAGTLRSVQTSAHKMVGFNAYDNASGTARLLGGMEYQITSAYTALAYSTGETITPDANGKFTPGANGTLNVTGGNATTTCVHLVWDGERDGEYEPYQAWNYPLDDSLTLRGVPTLDANNKLRYDGDTYASDGTVTRRYGIVDLGSLVWYSSSVEGRYTASVDGKKPGLNNFIQAKYSVGNTYAAENDKVISGNDSRSTFSIKDTSAATAEELKTSLSGVYLVYELETPTAESADPYTNPQIVDDFGTEEYVDAGVEAGARDVAIPVGHETFYQANLRAKLEAAPDSPDGDGDYLLRQTNGENVYVPFVTDTTMNVSGKAADAAAVGVGMRNLLGVLQELAGVLGDTTLPAMPDGTYILKATVTNGEVSYSWIAET